MMSKKNLKLSLGILSLLAATVFIPGCALINPPQTPVHIPDPYRENPRIVFKHINLSASKGSAISVNQFSYHSDASLQGDSEPELAKVSFRQAYGESLNNRFNGLQGTNANNDVSVPSSPSVPGLTIPINPPPPGLIKALGNSVTQPLPLPPNHQERMQKILQQPIQMGPSVPANISQQSNPK